MGSADVAVDCPARRQMEQRRGGLRSAKELVEVIGTASQTRPVWPTVFSPCDPGPTSRDVAFSCFTRHVRSPGFTRGCRPPSISSSVVGTVRDDPRPALTLAGIRFNWVRWLSTGAVICPEYGLQRHQVNGLTVGRHRHCSQRGLWHGKYLRVFMAVWLSIFPDHIWLVGTLPSLRKELGRSLR